MAQGQNTRVEITLSRDLRLLDITMIGIGAMIGAGIFVLMGSAKEVAGSAAIIALVLNGFVTLITAMSYAELGSCFPQAGGVYLWAREGLPAPAGFLSGWMSWTAAMIACSLYAVGFGGFVAFLMGATGVHFFLLTKIIAVLIVLFFVFINHWGAQTTGKTEGIITLTKIVVLGIFIGAGFAYYVMNPSLGSDFVNQFFAKGGSTIFLAMGLTFVAFEGYEIIAQSGEEVKDPKKNIPRAIFISIAVSVILYVLVFYVAYPKLDAGEAGSETAMLRAGMELFGVAGYILMVVGGLLATTSALNATIYSSSRVSFAMGRDKVIPTKLGEVNEKRRTPSNAVLVSGGLIIMMAMVPDIETIAAAAGIMFLLLFAIANACVISLRKRRPDLDRGFKVPLVPIVPLIGIFLNLALATAVWFLIGEAGGLGTGQIAWYLALAWIVGGLAIHYPTGGRRAIAEIGMERRKELLELLAEEKAKVDRKAFRVMVSLSDLENEDLVRFGALVARHRDGELALMNVYEVPAAMPPKAVTFSMVASRIKKLERLERLARRTDVKTRSLIKIGHSPYQNVLDSAEEEAVDILVLGWRGRLVGGRRILGSNVDHMVQKANCDVVVFKTAGLPKKINNILVISGVTWHASYATNMAIALAREHEAEITVLTVVEDKTKEEEDIEYSKKLLSMCEEAGVTSRHHVVYARTMVGAVVGESAKHDLIVMGATAEWERKEYAFGRITDQLAKKIDKPILMFRKVIPKESTRETES